MRMSASHDPGEVCIPRRNNRARVARLGDPAALRTRAVQEGYLFFRGPLPAADVLDVRRHELAVVERYGWRASGQDSLGGRLSTDALNAVPEAPMRTDIGVSIAAYHDVQRLASMHRQPHHPRLLEVYRALFGSEVLVHPRHISRIKRHRHHQPRIITAQHGSAEDRTAALEALAPPLFRTAFARLSFTLRASSDGQSAFSRNGWAAISSNSR